MSVEKSRKAKIYVMRTCVSRRERQQNKKAAHKRTWRYRNPGVNVEKEYYHIN